MNTVDLFDTTYEIVFAHANQDSIVNPKQFLRVL